MTKVSTIALKVGLSGLIAMIWSGIVLAAVTFPNSWFWHEPTAMVAGVLLALSFGVAMTATTVLLGTIIVDGP